MGSSLELQQHYYDPVGCVHVSFLGTETLFFLQWSDAARYTQVCGNSVQYLGTWG